MRLCKWMMLWGVLVAGGCAAPPGGERAEGSCPQTRLPGCPDVDRPSFSGPGGARVPASHIPRETLEDVARGAMAAVVRIRAVLDPYPDPTGPSDGIKATANRSGGTGIIIAAEGIILTSAHVVHQARAVTVVLADGSTHPATKILTDSRLDLAVLRIEAGALDFFAFTSEPPKGGAPVVAVAAPGRQQPGGFRLGKVTSPSVSLQGRLDPAYESRYDRLIESTTRLETGFSGGPLLNARGQLVGLNVAALRSADDHQARGYAIPFDRRTRDVVARLLTKIGAARFAPAELRLPVRP